MKDQKHKERINYIIEDGLYIGQSVNYRGLIIQADSIEDLKDKMFHGCKMWGKFLLDGLEIEEPFDLKELTKEEWDAKDDNITYWEMERFKRLMTTREDFRTDALEWIKININP